MYGLGDDITDLDRQITKLKAKLKAQEKEYGAEIAILKECIDLNAGTGLRALYELRYLLAYSTVSEETKQILSWKFETGEDSVLVAKGDNIKNNVYLPMPPYEVMCTIVSLASSLSTALGHIKELAKIANYQSIEDQSSNG